MGAISRIIDLYEIEDKVDAFNKIIICFNISADIARNKDKKDEDN